MLRLLITDKVEEGEGRIQNCYDIENPDIFNNFVMFTCLINKESVWTCSNIKELYSFNQLYRESKLPNIVCVKKKYCMGLWMSTMTYYKTLLSAITSIF